MFKKSQYINLSLVLVVLSMMACSKNEEEQVAEKALPEVLVQEIVKKEVPVTLEWIASVEGNTNATIRAQVEGYLIKQNYAEGSQVKKGDVLFEIDPRPFEAALEKAKSEYNEAVASLKTAQADLVKVEPLAKMNAVSKRDLDNARGAVDTRSAQVTAAQAAVDAAQLNLDFTKVTAPIDGLVGVAKAQIGDLVGPATGELTTMSSLDPAKVFIPITEQQYLWAMQDEKEDKDGDGEDDIIPLHLILSNGVEYSETGRFAFADRSMDPSTGTMKVASLFPNPKYLLRPGMSAKVKATITTGDDSLLISKDVITEVQGLFEVMVADKDDVIAKRSIKLGADVNGLQVVQSGLQDGDRIVVSDRRALKAGDKVKVTVEKAEEPEAADTKGAEE